MSGSYSSYRAPAGAATNLFENGVVMEAPLSKSNFPRTANPFPTSGSQQHGHHGGGSRSHQLMSSTSGMMLSDKEIASLYANIDQTNGDPDGHHSSANSKCGKNLVNNKQKQCEAEQLQEEDEQQEQQQQADDNDSHSAERSAIGENFKYSSGGGGSMCLTNPFMEKKNPAEHGRIGEDRNQSVRLLCDNNRNRKDTFSHLLNGGGQPWGAIASQDFVDVNENFLEPSVAGVARMSAYADQYGPSTAVAVNNNNNGCYMQRYVSPKVAGGDVGKPKRPQSIAVVGVGQHATPGAFNRDQFKGFTTTTTTSRSAGFGATNGGRMLDANLASMGFSVFKGQQDNSVLVDQQRTSLRNGDGGGGGGPLVQPHRRSQSTPRPVHNGHSNSLSSAGCGGGGGGLTTTNGLPQQQLKKKSENRPKSLDRGVSYLENVTVQSSVNFNVMHQATAVYNQFGVAHAPQLANTSEMLMSKNNLVLGGLKSSASFHGQFNLSAELGGGGSGVGGIRQQQQQQHPTATRPLSYTCSGSITEQAFLENQLRAYSEQLKTITESVRKYSEKAKLLSELKRQEMLRKGKAQSHTTTTNGYALPTSKSDSRISALAALQQPSPSLSSTLSNGSGGVPDGLINAQLNQGHKQTTSSHQLRLFLEDIRSNIRDSSVSSGLDAGHEATGSSAAAAAPQLEAATTVMADKGIDSVASVNATPLPLYSEPQKKLIIIPELHKSQQQQQQPPPIPERKRQALNDNKTAVLSATEPESKPDFKAGNPLLSSGGGGGIGTGSTSKTTKMLRSNELDFNQILDNFNFATKRFMDTNRMDSSAREDYLTAMQRTSNEIRQAALNIKRQSSATQQDLASCSSDENSSTSTTPGSIREAVQSLLAMPRNGVQVMDDRMRLFIDILDTQDKFSQVPIDG